MWKFLCDNRLNMINSVYLKYGTCTCNGYSLDKWPDNQKLKSVTIENSNRESNISIDNNV